jgi:hypothetical protein
MSDLYKGHSISSHEQRGSIDEFYKQCGKEAIYQQEQAKQLLTLRKFENHLGSSLD